MSGSSLDGLDLAMLYFPSDFYQTKNWRLVKADTISYSENWTSKLKSGAGQKDFNEIHSNFGVYIGDLVKQFLSTDINQPELIVVHGHTLYHQPSKGVSVQLGAAQAVANVTQIPTMDDFRTQDILLGGQGAPLAPTVEHWLYSDHQVFLNIGGIQNLSVHKSDDIIAFDIGAGNQLLNALSQEIGKAYDENGEIAKQGKVIESLLELGKKNQFYSKEFPKSLSNQWVQDEVIPVFKNDKYSLPDRMATAVALVSWSLVFALEQVGLKNKNILVSGGGAYNKELINTMEKSLQSSGNTLVIPDENTINYKEASLMALMGYLNITGTNNIFGQSTGSKINHCAGNLCIPNSLPLV